MKTKKNIRLLFTLSIAILVAACRGTSAWVPPAPQTDASGANHPTAQNRKQARAAAADAARAWAQVPAILKRIVPPRFPARDFDITKFGAVGDGQTDCTQAFADAIAACSKAGGGRVVVPAGRFLTGAIHLQSYVNLHVAESGTILFSTDPENTCPWFLRATNVPN